jgi:hypothetical protein
LYTILADHRVANIHTNSLIEIKTVSLLTSWNACQNT